jgi:chromosomal replication initiation ATPase DnaA
MNKEEQIFLRSLLREKCLRFVKEILRQKKPKELNLVAEYNAFAATTGKNDIECIIETSDTSHSLIGSIEALTAEMKEVREGVKFSVIATQDISFEDSVIRIIEHVAIRFDIDPELIIRREQKRKIVRPRDVIVWILYHKKNLTEADVARRVGYTDHSSVSSSLKRSLGRLGKDEYWEGMLNLCIHELKKRGLIR